VNTQNSVSGSVTALSLSLSSFHCSTMAET